MNRKRIAGYIGVTIYGGATALAGAGEAVNPKQVNDLSKGFVYMTTVSGTNVGFVHTVPNTVIGKDLAATPWDEVGKFGIQAAIGKPKG